MRESPAMQGMPAVDVAASLDAFGARVGKDGNLLRFRVKGEIAEEWLFRFPTVLPYHPRATLT